jgi:L-lactate dehydrogenase complex protein LldF
MTQPNSLLATRHSQLATQFNQDEPRVSWHDQALWFVREKRDRMAYQLPEWEQLRETASQIKMNVLANLDNYLVELEANALKNNIQVHWAADAQEHNEIVWHIIQQHYNHNVPPKQVVKSKSMLTEECHLNDFLLAKGVEVIDTDLGERIVQMRKEAPSHIVLPAIHLKKEDVGDTFHEHLGTEKGASDPQYLTEAARQHLREKFLQADIAITGVNFAVADTGGFVVCTNEGNADMGAHLAKVHIACMGIEKVIPKAEHLGIFLRLLARSATGQPITTYSSHFQQPQAGQTIHLVLVDNGRSRQLGREDFRNSLKCIRCGACFNTCPVYRRSGGHSYHNAVAGPIGSILAPNIDLQKNADLPFASTLCGSCTDVCPVKINIHEQLWKWRQVVVANGYVDTSKKIAMNVMASVLANPALYRISGGIARKAMKLTPALFAMPSINAWAKQRDMPTPPQQSFREWYLSNK